MNWFVLRQHRKQFMMFGILLLAIAAFVIPTGVHYWHSYQHALASAQNCSAASVCGTVESQVFGSGASQVVRNMVFAVGLFAPLLVGLFLGSPLIAREYNEGTAQLAWAQSVSRRKWLTTKLLWALGFALLYGVVITLLTTWWSRTSNVVYQNRFNPGVFDVQGLMPVADSIFFTAVGFTMGAWFRKTVVALGITIGAFVVMQIVFPNFIRLHYMTPVSATSAIGMSKGGETLSVGSRWFIAQDVVDKHGTVQNFFGPPDWPAECQKLAQDIQVSNDSAVAKVKAQGGDPVDACLNQYGYKQLDKYQPSYRYWDFQRIEAGIYLGMTAVAVGATYWLVLKRDA